MTTMTKATAMAAMQAMLPMEAMEAMEAIPLPLSVLLEDLMLIIMQNLMEMD